MDNGIEIEKRKLREEFIKDRWWDEWRTLHRDLENMEDTMRKKALKTFIKEKNRGFRDFYQRRLYIPIERVDQIVDLWSLYILGEAKHEDYFLSHTHEPVLDLKMSYEPLSDDDLDALYQDSHDEDIVNFTKFKFKEWERKMCRSRLTTIYNKNI